MYVCSTRFISDKNTSFEPTTYHNKFETMNFNGFHILVFEKKRENHQNHVN